MTVINTVVTSGAPHTHTQTHTHYANFVNGSEAVRG